MHVSCIQAGTLLARLGRPEVKNCIDGLEQYSYSYEEAGDQANDMKRTYQQAINGDYEFSHMAQATPRMVPDSSMAVDEQDVNGNDSPHVRFCILLCLKVSLTCAYLSLTLTPTHSLLMDNDLVFDRRKCNVITLQVFALLLSNSC